MRPFRHRPRPALRGGGAQPVAGGRSPLVEVMPAAHLLPRWGFRSAVLSDAHQLTPTARLLLVAIDEYRSGKAPVPFPGQRLLAADMNMTDRTVREAMHEAEAAGWLGRERRTTGRGRRAADALVLQVPDVVAEALAKRKILPVGLAEDSSESSGKILRLAQGADIEASPSATGLGKDTPNERGLVLRSRRVEGLVASVNDYLAHLDQQTRQRLEREQIERVIVALQFALWAKRCGHAMVRLDERREALGLARCREMRPDAPITVASELFWAVEGMAKDPAAMGQDPEIKRHDRYEILVRDRAHIERFAGACRGFQAGRMHALAVRYFGEAAEPASTAAEAS